MKRFVLALDQGTTSSRAILFDSHGRPCSAAQREITQHYPQPGWVEHDPEEIWESQLAVAHQALARINAKPYEIAAMGITNQRETTILWNRETGQAVHNAIVWQDRRTAGRCEELAASGLGPTIQQTTGLVVDSYFSATKLEWLLDHIPDARAAAERGQLAFGTVDSFLLWRLTGGCVHATDITNASRTMLFDIRSMDWSEDLLGLFHIPRALLPEVASSVGAAAETYKGIFGSSIPISGIAGDQQAATFGQACFHPGMAKSTYGTGCFLLVHTGVTPRPSANRLLTTPAAGSILEPEYALEGSVFVAGAAVQWLREELGIIRHAADVEELALSVEDAGGVYVVPAFTGLGAPYWDSSARGAILGLTRGAGKGHIARATLESIAYQCRDVLEAMARDCGSAMTEIRVDGGAASNDLLMQFQADICGIPVVRPVCTETTALGAAYLAGLAVGFWESREQIESLWTRDRTFEPSMSEDRRDALYRGWQDAVARVRTA